MLKIIILNVKILPLKNKISQTESKIRSTT